MANLFNEYHLQKKIADYQPENIEDYRNIFINWHNFLKNATQGEKQLQGDFLNDIFGNILGYKYQRNEQEINLEKEEKTTLDGQKPDGVLGFFTFESKDYRVVIELKDNKTNLDAKQNRKGDNRSPVEQAFGYVTKYQGIEFVIVSNFKEIRLYKSNYQGKYQQFKIEELAIDDNKIKEFHFLLSKQNLIGIGKDTESLVKKLLDDENKRETEIQNKFYKEYKELREEFVNNILKQNKTTVDIAIAKAQKLFDRLIFIRFCEDNNFITKPFERLDAGRALGLNLWEALKLLFTSIDKGNPPYIHKFNGGLFANDEAFNDIKIEFRLLQKLISFLRLYHFKNDISINILGHIFEQSITDLEALKAGLNDENHNKKVGKRKKDGIFYTPEYITKYIVAEAVGGWLKEKKDELKIDEIIPQEVPITKPKKWINPNAELINRYKIYSEKLKSIKVLDPACGSGAFLIEVFNYLENEWLNLSETLKRLGDDIETGLFTYQIIYKSILQNNIYGVDLNSESVQITKLSLWIKTANLQDELTTLDNNIKCGNSLIDDESIETSFYYDSEGNKISKAFNWHNQFPAVFHNGGFDVVVGNPPYVDIKILQPHLVEYIFKNYKSAENRINLYSTFIERGFNLVKDGGFISMIIPNSLLLNSSYSKLRELMFSGIYNIIKLPDDVFEAVKVESIIFCCRKNKVKDSICSIIYDSKDKISSIKNSKAIIFNKVNWIDKKFNIFAGNQDLISKIEANSILFFRIADFSLGITPYDKYKGHSQEIIDNRKFHSKTKLDDTYKPIISGDNIKRFAIDNRPSEFIKYGEHLGAMREEKFFMNPRIIIRQIVSPRIYAGYTEEVLYFTQIGFSVIIKDKDLSPKYITALLNSKLFTYYHSNKFIDTTKTLFQKILIENAKKLPIKIIASESQAPFITQAQKMLDLTAQFNELSNKFTKLLSADLGVVKITKKLEKWHNLEVDEFFVEVAKQNKNLSLSQKSQWLEHFEDKKQKAIDLQNKISKTDSEIDYMVYELYGLSNEEIKIIEES
jgi:hypothetical protein